MCRLVDAKHVVLLEVWLRSSLSAEQGNGDQAVILRLGIWAVMGRMCPAARHLTEPRER